MADTRTPTTTPAGHDAQPPTAGRTLRVRHCATRHGAPLADVYGLPGDGAELRPAEMRSLAYALLAAAADCDALPISNGRRRIERAYPAGADAEAAPLADAWQRMRDVLADAAPPAGGALAPGHELTGEVGDLWFLLDQIESVSATVPLVQEHMADAEARAGRVEALARTVECLAALAKTRHAVIERLALAL